MRPRSFAPALIALLIAQARRALDLAATELLRLYWYDGVLAGGLTPEQRSICELPDVQDSAALTQGSTTKPSREIEPV